MINWIYSSFQQFFNHTTAVSLPTHLPVLDITLFKTAASSPAHLPVLDITLFQTTTSSPVHVLFQASIASVGDAKEKFDEKTRLITPISRIIRKSEQDFLSHHLLSTNHKKDFDGK